jgi:hypothetical protein
LGQSERNARVQRAELAARSLLSISAFRAKFGLGVIWLSEVRVGVLFQGKSTRKSIAGNGADATAPATPGIVISNLRGEAIGDAVNAFRWSIATALVLEGLPLAKITVAAQCRRGRGFATVSL